MKLWQDIKRLFCGSRRDDRPSRPMFTKDQFAFLIKANGLCLVSDGMLVKYPYLANCRVADGISCLSSAALLYLYCITYGDEQNSRKLRSLSIKILISFPEIYEASKRALEYVCEFPQEKYDGLMEIANGDTFIVNVFLVSQWLYIELSQNDMDNYNEEVVKELSNQLQFWFDRIPGIDMIQS
ncbi:MAG: hypothetical protein IKU71_03460 [Kiritimatiellae bacterium]|nr:hypothetical protein [Kiritimatiellia bacterium]